MLTMDQIHRIRQLYYEQGLTNLSEIARLTGLDWKTVSKYVDMMSIPYSRNHQSAIGYRQTAG